MSVFFRQKPGSHFLFAANKCILNGIESVRVYPKPHWYSVGIFFAVNWVSLDRS